MDENDFERLLPTRGEDHHLHPIESPLPAPWGASNSPSLPRNRHHHHHNRMSSNTNINNTDVDRNGSCSTGSSNIVVIGGGGGGGLHHRHVRSGSGDAAYDEYERGLASFSSSTTAAATINGSSTSGPTTTTTHNGTAGGDGTVSKYYYYQPGGGKSSVVRRTNTYTNTNNTNNNKRYYPSCSRWIRTCLVAGIPAYLVLIFLFLKQLNHKHSLLQQQQQRRHSSGGRQQQEQFQDVRMVQNLYATMQLEQTSRTRRDERDWKETRVLQESARDRASQRKQQSTPPTTATAALLLRDISPTVILSAASAERALSHFEPDEAPRLALTKRSDAICGSHAQTAAARTPDAFAVRDSLIMPKARITRVLITGIFSQPGYLLALALKERCNVEVIIGFDAMYPNSLRNRFRLLEPMALLTKYIPKLVRPFFMAHMGLDPVRHSKSFQILPATQEMDLVQTMNPTHIVHFASYDPALFQYSDPDWKNVQSPYVRTGNGAGGDTKAHDPGLLALRSGMLSMEQILASIAAAPSNERPHLIYASASKPVTPSSVRSPNSLLHSWGRRIDELLADFYYQQHGVYSVGLRLPNTVYGPWSHPESTVHQIFHRAARNIPATNETWMYGEMPSSDMSDLELLHADDVVDAVIAAMQYRHENSKPVVLEVSATDHLSPRQLELAAAQILDKENSSPLLDQQETVVKASIQESAKALLKKRIGWTPRVSLREGLIRSMAWYVDRFYPFGPPVQSDDNVTDSAIQTGDMLLKRHEVQTCSPKDLSCHNGLPYLPCASECSSKDQCLPTAFDDLVPLVRELTEECDIVLYTQNFNKDATDLNLQAEYVEDAIPLICNFAFVNGDSELVDTVIGKVPDRELGKLGFDLGQEGLLQSGDLMAKKRTKLNGRLLYRGWILIWTKSISQELATHEKFLLKLSPGRLFHSDVKSAVFIDQEFGVSPKADDIMFLANEMHRKAWNSRVVKRKTRPKAKFLLPEEPPRHAALLMSVLKYQDSSVAARLAPDVKITTYEATRFMRHSNGEEPLGKELPSIKLQREFYDRIRASINSDHARGPGEPLHKFELNHWVRSRWVAHDLVREESRQLRCNWYQEHVLWENDLDQLSFAFIMEKMELDRKLEFGEPDETIQKQLAEKTEMKKFLTDTFEWIALKTEPNKHYSPYTEMKMLPYEMDHMHEQTIDDQPGAREKIPMFVRIISDRIMASARIAWSNPKMKAEDSFSKSEL